MFENRTYRALADQERFTGFTVTSGQTNLQIYAHSDLTGPATDSVLNYREQLAKYIHQYPVFGTTLAPYHLPSAVVPAIIREMSIQSAKASVGPMASVAGIIAEYVGKELLNYSPEVIVENGGDIFLSVEKTVSIGIYAGESPLSMKVGLRFVCPEKPFSVCTSSGRVGHSLSLGKSDAVCVVSDHAALADAAATAIGNYVKKPDDIQAAIAFGNKIAGVDGIVIISGDKMGLWGQVDIIKL